MSVNFFFFLLCTGDSVDIRRGKRARKTDFDGCTFGDVRVFCVKVQENLARMYNKWKHGANGYPVVASGLSYPKPIIERG